MSGLRVSVTSSVSDPAYKDSPSTQNDAAQNDRLKNNRVNGDDLHSPNFDEAITAIIDENGGVHLNDGPGSLFALVAPDQSPGEDEGNVFLKNINSEVKQNIRRGLTESQLYLINRTQLALQDSRAKSRYQYPQRNQQHTTSYSTQHDRPALGHETGTLPPRHNFTRTAELQQPLTQRPNSRTPRQRIHIIVNNRTQVQEIPIDDEIDFQRIPAIQQTPPQVTRYSNPRTIDHIRRPLPVATPPPPPVMTTTPVPRRETTERQRAQVNERRQLSLSGRTLPPIQPEYNIQPEITSVKRDTMPQRPSPIYRTPEPYSTASACNQKACRLPDCFCAGSEIPGNSNSANYKFFN